MHQQSRVAFSPQKKDTTSSYRVGNERHWKDRNLRAKIFDVAQHSDDLEIGILRGSALVTKGVHLDLASERILHSEEMRRHSLIDDRDALRRIQLARSVSNREGWLHTFCPGYSQVANC